MTLADIQAAWVRFMHRRDLDGDLALITSLAAVTVRERLMYVPDPEPTDEELAASIPVASLHAGLMKLHELAQDDEGLMRESELFRGAIADHHMSRSLLMSDASMEPS